jgi:hypothetical protein
MSQRPQILAACLRLLACGPTTTRDLSLHTRTPRALIAVALHGEPGVTRNGDEWSLAPAQLAAEQAKRARPDGPGTKIPGSGRAPCTTIVYLREHPGWHTYADLAEACRVTYSAVVLAVKRHQSDLKFTADAGRRVLVAWKGAEVTA